MLNHSNYLQSKYFLNEFLVNQVVTSHNSIWMTLTDESIIDTLQF